jgi:hypothetical protein
LYWKSLYNWAIEEKLPLEYKTRIYLSYKSFDLSQLKGMSKYITILIEGIKSPNTKDTISFYVFKLM